MRRMRSVCESGLVTLSQMARRVPAAKLLPVSRLQCLLGLGAPSCALASTALFSYSCDNTHPATAQPSYLTSYFDDDTFIRFQVYWSIYFSWHAIQAAA